MEIPPFHALAASSGVTLADASSTVYNHPPPPVLLGGLVALFLSGAVFMQVLVYYQVYQSDLWQTKCIVFTVWILDLIHSSFVSVANWQMLIQDYGRYDTLDFIQWPIPITIALTALTTMIVHSFFIHRIFKLSVSNWYITVPLIALALLRVGSAFVTTAEMLRLRSYTNFVAQYNYIFTLGLATSTVVDVLITITMCYFLRRKRPEFPRLVKLISHLIDALTLYTIENGLLTCVAVSLSLFFWLFMRSNFVFLGMHLAINKLYANSLLASLNARKTLAHKGHGSRDDRYPLPVMFHQSPPHSPRDFSRELSSSNKPMHVQVAIDVERTIQHDSILQITSTSSPPESDVGSPRKSTDSNVLRHSKR